MGDGQAMQQSLELAAQEARAGGFDQVTPAHVLIGLCRLSESETVGGDLLRREFEALGLDTPQFRRRLRRLLGPGSAIGETDVIHRSPECRAVYQRARDAAAKGQTHPLVALLEATWSELLGAGVRPSPSAIPDAL